MSNRHQLLLGLAMLAVALALPTTEASGQERDPLRQPASVPLDLATALASAGGFASEGDPQILVGELPEWVAARVYLPPGSRVLGSAFIGSTVVGVVSVPTSSDTVLKDFERQLQQRGWKAPPPPPSYGGGFRPAPTPSAARVARRFTLCGDGQTITAWISRQQAMSTTVVMRLSASGNAGVCNPPQYPRDMQRSPIPTLFDPEGATDARMARDCSPSFGMSNATSTRLRTTMSPEVLLEHYGRQLQDSGWASARTVPTIVGRTWTRRDSTGAPVQVSLSVTTSPQDSTCRAVNLELQTQRRP